VLLKSYTKIFIFICSSSEDETSKKDKYEQKGVDEEKGLRKNCWRSILNSYLPESEM
jgi:hypothetical protein